jgi:hypothetical protein
MVTGQVPARVAAEKGRYERLGSGRLRGHGYHLMVLALRMRPPWRSWLA